VGPIHHTIQGSLCLGLFFWGGGFGDGVLFLLSIDFFVYLYVGPLCFFLSFFLSSFVSKISR